MVRDVRCNVCYETAWLQLVRARVRGCAVADVAVRWRLPPHSRTEVILLVFQSHTAGVYGGYVHIMTNVDDMVVPVELTVVKGGMTPSTPLVMFFGFSSDRVRSFRTAVGPCVNV
jgi:hypothetical protein